MNERAKDFPERGERAYAGNQTKGRKKNERNDEQLGKIYGKEKI